MPEGKRSVLTLIFMTEICPSGESTQPTKEPDYSQGSDDPLKDGKLRTDMTTLPVFPLTRAWIDRRSVVRGREVSSIPSLCLFLRQGLK